MNTSLGLAEPVTNYEVGPNFLVSLEKKKCLSVRNSIPRTCCLRAQNLPMETSDPLKKIKLHWFTVCLGGWGHMPCCGDQRTTFWFSPYTLGFGD